MVIKLKNKSEFANRLMQRRKEIGLSRTELGENIGFSGQQANKNIYNNENSIREPEYATLVKISEVLQC